MNAPIEVQKRSRAYLRHIGIDIDLINKGCFPTTNADIIEVKRCRQLNNHWVNTGEGEMLLPENEYPTWSYFMHTKADGITEISFGSEEVMKAESELIHLQLKKEWLESEIRERDKTIGELTRQIKEIISSKTNAIEDGKLSLSLQQTNNQQVKTSISEWCSEDKDKSNINN